MTEEELIKKIKAGLPDSKVQAIDLNGTGDHFSAVVISAVFVGKNRIQQHQAVYSTVADVLTKELHALQLSTYTPEQWQEKQGKT